VAGAAYPGHARWRRAALYVLIAYGLPDVREVVPAALPVGLGVGAAYATLMLGERQAAEDTGASLDALAGPGRP
jgi:hypothetical protein